MSINIKTLITNVIQICDALSNSIRQNQHQEVQHLWRELLDLRATIAALELGQKLQTNTQVIDHLIDQIRPAYQYWCQQRSLPI